MDATITFDGCGFELGWPAQDTWPRFLRALHSRIAAIQGSGYADKDILLASRLKFRRGRDWEVLRSFEVTIVRFNERSRHSMRRDRIRVTLEWNGSSVKGCALKGVSA